MKIQSIWKISFLSFAFDFFNQSSPWAQKETIGVTAVKPAQAILQNVDRTG